MNPPASEAGLALAEQVLHYVLFAGPGDMTIGEVLTMIERLFGPTIADALADRHRPSVSVGTSYDMEGRPVQGH